MKPLLRRLLILVLLWGAVSGVYSVAQIARISPEATFSLITDAPGDALYMAFGHSAIRLRDSAQNLDVVFNYGTFDFDEPNFYLKFARGKLRYALSDAYFSQYVRKPIPAYTEQLLLLSPSQKELLFRFLWLNIQEDNRWYAYDFFYDNCATRIRDALVQVCGDSLVFPVREADKSFRDLLHEYLRVHPWMELGIDVVLGLPADRVATSDQQMFLPDYLSESFEGATLNGAPLVGEKVFLSGSSEDWMPKTPFPWPLLVGWLVLLSGLFLTLRRCAAGLIWFDRVFFFLVGLVGLIIFFLWFCTEHAAAKNNLNLFWAFPWHLVAAFLLHRKPLPAWASMGFRVSAVSALALLCGWAFLPQNLHEALIPVVLLVLLRSVMLAWPDLVRRIFCSR